MCLGWGVVGISYYLLDGRWRFGLHLSIGELELLLLLI